jgi:hypothetical protein
MILKGSPRQRRFFVPLGRIVVSKRSSKKLESEDVIPALGRHILGDFGRVSNRRREANQKALWQKKPVRSVYFTGDGVRFRVVTNATRSLTKVEVY